MGRGHRLAHRSVLGGSPKGSVHDEFFQFRWKVINYQQTIECAPIYEHKQVLVP